MASDRSRKVLIGAIAVDNKTFGETVDLIEEWARQRSGGYVCTPNADHVVQARRNGDFRRAVSGARLRVPDGMLIVYASRVAGRPLAGTVTGRLLVPAVADRLRGSGLGLTLFGAGPGVAEAAARKLADHIPGLDIPAALSPPMNLVVGSEADRRIVSEIQAIDPAVLFVALGAPKQELWMHHHHTDLPRTVMVGVGGAFDIIAGRYREAPRWMTRVGLEWLFRLAQEPRRLVRRYLIDDPWVLFWALRTRFGYLE